MHIHFVFNLTFLSKPEYVKVFANIVAMESYIPELFNNKNIRGD
jgi:hypothetical protein